MTAKRQEFKMGDIFIRRGTRKGWYLLEEVRERVFRLTDDDLVFLVTLSDTKEYEHLRPVTRIGRPPKTRKAAVPDLMSLEAEMKEMLSSPEQASTSSTVLPTPIEPLEGQKQAQNTEVLDPATFDLQVKGEGRLQHKMTLTVKTADGKDRLIVAHGKDLKPTLLRLLGEFGITGSAAEVIESLKKEYLDSPERARMLDILKEGG